MEGLDVTFEVKILIFLCHRELGELSLAELDPYFANYDSVCSLRAKRCFSFKRRLPIKEVKGERRGEESFLFQTIIDDIFLTTGLCNIFHKPSQNYLKST